MAYVHVEDLPDQEGSRSASLVEDDEGFPVLLLAPGTDRIPAHVWQRAYDAAVVLIVREDGFAISADEFVAERREHPGTLSYEVTRWVAIEQPTVRAYLTRDQAPSTSPVVGGACSDDFVHLHTHTEYSPLDGLSTLTEIAEVTVAHGGRYIVTTDHGNCAAHPEAQAVADKYGLRAIFGMEAYFVPDRFRRSRTWLELDGVEVEEKHLTDAEKKKAEKCSDSREARNEYTHLTLWAQSQVGLRNLWAMSTEAYRDGLYDGKPRLDWDTLDRLNEDVLAGTGCLRGPVSRCLMEDDEDGARDALLRLLAIFGDRLYVEIHTNGLEIQRKVNHRLVALAREYRIPMIAAVDSHYAIPEQKVVHKAWLAMQTGKTMTEDTSLFEGDQDYHLSSVAEVRAALADQNLDEDVIDEAIRNTVTLAERCTAEVRGEVTTPTYSKPSAQHPDPVLRDVERVMEVCFERWDQRTRGKSQPQKVYLDRFEREINLLVQKKFCGYFLIVWDYVSWAKREGCLVGPSRGSGGGSLVAYLLGITETDPVEQDLIFERFLTEGRTSLPDFDIDFPSSWRSRITSYIRERWGEEYTSNIGTITRLRSKQAINDVVRVLEPVLPYEVDHKAFEALKKAVDAADAPLAGKHLPWEEFCDQFSDIVDPMRQSYPEIFEAVDAVVDRLKTYGKHAAGVVISTGAPLTDLPMRLAEDKKNKTTMMVTQFDMNALEILGYVKFDILTLRTLDTLQECVDLIETRYGRKVSPYDWVTEYEDPQVWEEVASGKTLGLFQVETASGTRMIRRMEPASVDDLAAVVTVVRPGPMRSGLTDAFLRRRAGIEPVSYPDPRMETFVGDTYACMIYQEQVMAACMTLAGYTSDEADAVRKLLGKKQIEKVQEAGEKFVARASENGTVPEVAASLWAQMAEFAKYGFGKAHAYAYAVLGYWTAWLKFHFPVEFLVACLSTVDMDRLPEFIDEVRAMGYGVKPPDVNHSKVPFTSDGLDVVYGLSLIKGIGVETAEQIVARQPYTSLDDFIARAVEKQPGEAKSAVNMGHVKTLVEVGAFDSIVENRRAVEIQLERESSGIAKRCIHKTEAANPAHPFNLPCGFDWSSEVDPPLIPRGRGKDKVMVAKAPPKACNIRCRAYQAPSPVAAHEVAPYSREEIMRRERESLGVWITASPWEQFREEHLECSDRASKIEAGPTDLEYVGICLVDGVKTRRDKNGNTYAFVTLDMQDGKIEPICFASVWVDKSRYIKKDAAGVAVLRKNSRGYQLVDYTPYY